MKSVAPSWYDRFLARVHAFLWNGKWSAEKRAEARRVAAASLLCSRCSCPLLPDELTVHLCSFCQLFNKGPRPLGNGTVRA